MYIGVNSTVSILPNTTVYWENNCATSGGAIYVHDVSPLSYCTLLIPYVPKKSASFNSLARLCPMVLMSNLFSITTLLMMQDVWYMVVQ